MEILVKCLHYSLVSTISEVYVDGKHFCDCLEDRVRAADAPKVFGKTAIPAGRYQGIWNLSNRFKIKMPLLLDVPGYEGVRIHAGNSEIDSLGCLLLGTYDKSHPDFVSNSRDAVNRFYAVYSKAAMANEKIWITIEDTQAPPTEPKAKVEKKGAK